MNPIFITIGNIQIYWYSVILFVAFALGAILALKEAKKYDISTDFIYNLFFYLVPTVLIGARICYSWRNNSRNHFCSILYKKT